MVRWEPDARGRLAQAAWELYAERGYEQTTVAEIAARAGLTERTFFRHYLDKREVLFEGSHALKDLLVSTALSAPADASPMAAVMAGLDAVGGLLQPGIAHSRRRWALIEANPELQERELVKMASLARSLTEVLRARGVPDSAAELAAEAGIAVFRLGFERWVAADDGTDLATTIRDALTELRAVTAG